MPPESAPVDEDDADYNALVRPAAVVTSGTETLRFGTAPAIGAPGLRGGEEGARGICNSRCSEQKCWRRSGWSHFWGAILESPEQSLSLFLIISERSSPSRVRFAAPNNGAPLTAPGRSEQHLLARGKGSSEGLRAVSAPSLPKWYPFSPPPTQKPQALDKQSLLSRSCRGSRYNPFVSVAHRYVIEPSRIWWCQLHQDQSSKPLYRRTSRVAARTRFPGRCRSSEIVVLSILPRVAAVNNGAH